MLSRWRSWGSVPQIFEEHTERGERLRSILTVPEWQAARRTIINAHYTHPDLAAAMWEVAAGLGFAGGRVLEPGCGSGTFIGSAPPSARDIIGVELDPITAAIAQALHPDATIRAESFASSALPDASCHLTIGNVPFGKIVLHDPVHNSGRHSIHNHFILKSLALTRPGGLVAVLTSRYSMDAENSTAREQMYQHADLLTAVRLPTGAHRAYAGTEAVTDLLVLRVRRAGEQPGPDDWLSTARDPHLLVPLNNYWRTHPEAVLGTMRISKHGMYGRDDLTVNWDRPYSELADQLHERALTHGTRRLDQLTRGGDATFTPTVAEDLRDVPEIARAATAQLDGHISRDDEGAWWSAEAGQLRPLEVPASCRQELASLVHLREALLRVLALERASRDDTAALREARADLAAGYDSYTHRYGAINRVTITETARRDRHDNPIVTRRYPGAVRLFRGDPHAPTVRALEIYDESTGTSKPAAILSRRVLSRHVFPSQAETPSDALAISLDTFGRVDLAHIASLLNLPDPRTARTRLGTLVFDDPGSGRLIPAAEYLSGNVRQALAAAQLAATQDSHYQSNVEALTAVIPPDLSSDEITASLGAVWIPASDVQHFLASILNDRTVQVEHLGGAKWKVRNGHTHSPAARVTWGTERMGAHEIVERLMCQKRVTVIDVVPDRNGRGEVSVVNPVETEAATAKAEALQARFQEWVWADPDRAERLTRTYNDTFNAIRLRSYDAEGERLSLPGLAEDFTPHPHQRAAVARMIGEPSVGLFHAVGAGKTAEMVMGATELRRLGLVTKPAVIVPNHMLEQVTREWLQLYPAANVLAAATEDIRGPARRAFVARAATGDWDAVILTHGAFAAIPVSAAGQQSYLNEEVEVQRAQLERARETGVSNQSLKQMEAGLYRLEEKIKKRLDHKTDPGLTWEQLGIDYLIVDELHLFKNLTIVSNIQDVAREGSMRATDLDMKIALIRAAAGPGGRVITGATATPIANTMAEAWVMQKYLRPDLLHDAGLSDFDSWAATFGRTVTKIEMRPAGDGFRAKDRFAAFQNLPELLALWHVPADVKTSRDLGLPIPAIAPDHDGHRTPEIVAIPLSEAQAAFMTTLAERSDAVRSRAVPPDEDNMLKISGDGRKAGLDLRLLEQTSDPGALFPETTKIDIAADRIHQIWAANRDRIYSGNSVPGALQIVFCDLGTPTNTRWNVYDALLGLLAERGMDTTRVRYAHEATTNEAKGRLFAQCRSGEVDVIIGSTAKMGVGTNIQARAIALHHLDCPWRPADVEQREGRILRQGNENPEVQILRYVTEGSFDGYMWQGIARKAAFIDQVMHGTLDTRTAEDLGGDGEQFDYDTVTAVASGNPLLLQRAAAQADLDKLTRLATAHERAEGSRRVAIRSASQALTVLDDLQQRLTAAIHSSTPTAGEAFAARVESTTYTERPLAAEAMRRVINSQAGAVGPLRLTHEMPGLLQLGGHTLDATLRHGTDSAVSLTLLVRQVPESRFTAPLSTLTEGHGLITRAENLVAGLPAALAAAEDRSATARRDKDEAHSGLGQPFKHAEQLTRARKRLEEIDAALHPDGLKDPATPIHPRHESPDTSPPTRRRRGACPLILKPRDPVVD